MLTFLNPLWFLNTDDSTSPGTGTLILSGGLGVGGSVLVGTGTTVQGSSLFLNNVSLGSSASLSITCTTESTGLGTGSLIVAGGVGIARDVSLATLQCYSNMDATSMNEASMVVDGGFAVAKTVMVGTTVSLLGTLDSTGSDSGTLVVAGGLGVAGAMDQTGVLVVGSPLDSTSATTGAVTISGDMAVAKSLVIDADFVVDGVASVTGTLAIGSTPIHATDAASKGYVDALDYLLGGTGLDVSASGIVSVTNDFSTVTSVGTLISLTCSGPVSVLATTVSSSVTTGALVLAGGMSVVQDVFIGGQVHVLGTSVLNGGVTVMQAPVASTDAVRKEYVDSLSFLTVGSGLMKTVGSGNTTVALTAAQTDVTAVGTLTGLACGFLLVTNTTNATSNPAAGAVVLSGGMGVAGTITVAGNTTFHSAVSFTSVSGPVPTLADALVNQGYVAALNYLVAGTGLNLTGGALSVNSNQSHVTAVGTLVGLDVSGVVTVASTAQTLSAETGAVLVLGGVAVVKNSVLGAALTVQGVATLEGGASITTATASAESHLVTKGYIDALTYFTAGTGLFLSGGSLSVNENQPGITSLGTLTSLTVSGAVLVTNTTECTAVGDGAMVVEGGLAIQKNCWIGGSLTVLGAVTIANAPAVALAVPHKEYVDSLAYFTAGDGLTLTSNTLDIVATSTSTTSVGTLTALTVSGMTLFTNTTPSTSSSTGSVVVAGGVGISKDVYVGSGLVVDGPVTFQGPVSVAAAPTMPTHLANKEYVDTVTEYIAGSGLLLTSGVLSVTPNQPDITVLGPLVSLTVSGTLTNTSTVNSDSVSTGSVVLAGGMAVTQNVFGGSLVATSDTVFASDVHVPATPVNGSEWASRGYIDELTYLVAGTGLTFTGSVLSVNATQPTVTGVGTLTSLTVSGTFLATLATDATSSVSGAVIVSGGLGITKNFWVGGSLSVSGPVVLGGAATGVTPVSASDLATKGYIDSLDYLAAGTGLVKSGMLPVIVGVTSNQPGITAVGSLVSLTVSGIVNATATTESISVSTGSVVVAGGMGVAKNLFLSTTRIAGQVVSANTTESEGLGTGSCLVSGGIGVIKNVWVGANMTVTGAGSSSVTGTTTVPSPVSASDAVTRAYCDAAFQGLSVRQSVRVATVTSGALSSDFAGGSVVDGVTLVAGDRILIKNQFSTLENGIYIVAETGGTAVRSADLDTGTDAAGIFCFVQEGTVNASSGWMCLNSLANDTVGTNALAFAQFSGPSPLVAGTGLDLTSGTLSVNANQSSVTGVGVLSSLAVDGPFSVTLATESTSASTGCMIISGGVGITGNMFVGGSLTVTGTSTFTHPVSIPTPGSGTGEGTNKDYVTGLSWLAAGTGLTLSSGTLSVNAVQTQITAIGTATGITVSGIPTLTATTMTTSVSTGAVLVSGGIGVAKSLFTNALAVVSNTAAGTTGMLHVTHTGAAANGATTVLASLYKATMSASDKYSVFLGKANNLEDCGNWAFHYDADGSAATNRIVFNLYGQNETSNVIAFGDGTVKVLHTTDAASVTGGIATVSGGVGVAKNVVVGGTAVFTGTVPSTSMSTGTLVTSGGIGVAKNVFLGGVNTVATYSHLIGNNATGVPTFTTRSAGSRLVLRDLVSSTTADHALLVGPSSTLICGVSAANTTTTINYYSNTTSVLNMSGWEGHMRFAGNLCGTASLQTWNVGNTLVFEDQTNTTVNSGTLAGTATYSQSNYIELTSATNGQTGSVSWGPQIVGASWSVSFDFFYNGAADYLAFGCYQTAVNVAAYLNYGGYMVLFSEWKNYIAMTGPSISNMQGNPPAGCTTISNFTTLCSNNAWHHALITFNHGLMQLWVNHALVGTYYAAPSSSVLNTPNYITFTGATGGSNAIHRIRNMCMTKGTTFAEPAFGAANDDVVFNANGTNCTVMGNVLVNKQLLVANANAASGAGATNTLAQYMKASLNTGESVVVQLGKSSSTNGFIGFTNVGGSGSASNMLRLGMTDVDFIRLTGAGITTVTVTTDATSSASLTDGALRLAGGISIAKNVVVAGYFMETTQRFIVWNGGGSTYNSTGSIVMPNTATEYYYVSLTTSTFSFPSALTSCWSWTNQKLFTTVTGLYTIAVTVNPSVASEWFISKNGSNGSDLTLGGSQCLAVATAAAADKIQFGTNVYLVANTDYICVGYQLGASSTQTLTQPSLSLTLLSQ